MSIILERLKNPECEKLHKAVVDLHMQILAAEFDLKSLEARHFIAMCDLKDFCGVDLTEKDEKQYRSAVEFLENLKDEEA